MSREDHHKALSAERNPSLATVLKVSGPWVYACTSSPWTEGARG